MSQNRPRKSIESVPNGTKLSQNSTRHPGVGRDPGCLIKHYGFRYSPE